MLFPNEQLKTPVGHGRTLIVPPAGAWGKAAVDTHRRLGTGGPIIVGRPLAEWRRETREALVGDPHRLLVVLGHQPAFIHPGVWAKHILADRLARAIGGLAVNLVVDTDVPKSSELAVPSTEGGTDALGRVVFPHGSYRVPFEHLPLQSVEQVGRFSEDLRKIMRDRFDRSQIPVYVEGVRAAKAPADWVDQAVAGRKAIDHKFGIHLAEHRISRHWCTPLVVDMIQNASRFTAAYNHALAVYRDRHRIRGTRRPMPDLECAPARCELPLWLERPGGRRHRLFLSRGGGLRFYADQELIAECSAEAVRTPDALSRMFADLEGWVLRPRAIALTLWARLLLADFFIHGIGGAKYDQITDQIMAGYYEVEPPAMACASATLHLDLGLGPIAAEAVGDLQRRIRDVRWNPQRYVRPSSETAALFELREAAVRAAQELKASDWKNHGARRKAFLAIRQASRSLLDTGPELLVRLRAALDRSQAAGASRRIACGRTYFFGLFDDTTLERLISALPGPSDFRV
ncbi:MAG: hypothetical protein ACE5E5_13615 [Phycisphaerae bacterium]